MWGVGEPDDNTLQRISDQLRVRLAAGSFRITQHAAQAMAEEDITLDEVVAELAAWFTVARGVAGIFTECARPTRQS